LGNRESKQDLAFIHTNYVFLSAYIKKLKVSGNALHEVNIPCFRPPRIKWTALREELQNKSL
jgi:hypothetical protein